MKYLFMILLLSGCVSWQKTHSAADRIETIQLASADVERVCSAVLGYTERNACAIWRKDEKGSWCLKIISESGIGEEHEQKHCDGYTHK